MFSIGDVFLNLYVFIYGLFWALLLAGIEGPLGWGGRFPDWKIGEGKWYAPFLKLFTFGRPLNLLPLYAILTFVISFFLPIVWNWSKNLLFTAPMWGELLAYFAVFAIHEDFFWFLANPHYGFSKFNKQHIPWHPHWLLGMPLDYWIGILLFTVLGILSRGVRWWIIVFLIQSLLVLLAIAVSNRLSRGQPAARSNERKLDD